MAAAALGQTWTTFVGIPVFGAAACLNTLCSQAIGSKNPKLAGVWLQLSVLIISILCIPVIVRGIHMECIIFVWNELNAPELKALTVIIAYLSFQASYFFTEPVLSLVIQSCKHSNRVCQLASVYTRWSSLQLWPLAIYW